MSEPDPADIHIPGIPLADVPGDNKDRCLCTIFCQNRVGISISGFKAVVEGERDDLFSGLSSLALEVFGNRHKRIPLSRSPRHLALELPGSDASCPPVKTAIDTMIGENTHIPNQDKPEPKVNRPI